jgi:ribose 5-phosphate isomerase B
VWLISNGSCSSLIYFLAFSIPEVYYATPEKIEALGIGKGEWFMRVAMGSDHAGFKLKQTLIEYVENMGHEVLNAGTDGPEPVDYPDFAAKVCKAILGGEAERGILICGSGVGASVSANKIPGIRAAICHDSYSSRQGVEHDDMNVLVLGARIVASSLAKDLVRIFLAAEFTGEERHKRRLEKITALEKGTFF